MSRIIAALLAVAAGSAALAVPASAASDHGARALTRDLEAVHRAGVTGVLAEIRDGRGTVRARAGIADLGRRRPVPYGAHFRMGSTTKTFVATVVLQLAGEGRLSLDDAVDRWLPGLVSGPGIDARRITVRHLLQHTSGLYDYLRDLPPTAEHFHANRFRTFAPGELVRLALTHAPLFEPGEGWSYSNTNYVLAGMVVAAVTGRAWEREVHDRITKPLGLWHTTSPGSSPSVPRPRAAAYHAFAPGDPFVDVTERNETWGDAAGNMITTTADLSRFWLALARGRLLARPQLTEMQRTVQATGFPVPGARYGLGLIWLPLSCGGGYWSHGGDTIGYSTRGGVTADGRRSMVVSLSSRAPDVQPLLLTDEAVDRTFCRR